MHDETNTYYYNKIAVSDLGTFCTPYIGLEVVQA